MYRPVPPSVDLPAMEREVLELWRERDTFARSVQRTADGEPWVFYEGPPTANGMPGTHHVEARVFKDVFPRYRTMKGRHVERKAGWDCHGLPVEIAVEKELGFSGKRDIEAYGVAEFNARCRSSVERHVDAFEAMTTRMGYWVDLSTAYRTMAPEYVDSLWWALKQIHDKGLLVEDHRIAPYCPRCGTALSDHELGQPGGYETVVDPSVYVRFPLTGGELAQRFPGVALLVWTTTPWTLVSNTAVAVNPGVDYVVARRRLEGSDGSASGESEVLVVAAPLVEQVLGEDVEVLAQVSGSELERMPYRRPFDLVEIPDAHYVVLGDYVTTEDGTGLVHQSPAFGADDLAVCKAYGLPVVNPVRPDGTFAPEVPLVGGQFFKDADKALVEDLRERGLLFRHLPYEHSYPHCWRCHTALLYYAQPSWYIRTTAVKDELMRENEATNWFPDTIQWGRYGDWLRNNVDWALSRNRFWGTPLPLWRCEDGHVTAVGSRKELGELAGRDLTDLDPHRPFVDEITLSCPQCGGTATRVPEVADAWFDSGSMPFAQWGYPWVEGSVERFEQNFPADFICEALDQTRGWFYTLMAVNTLVFGRSSYRNVLCLGLILAEDGRKMSKHLGNVLEPIPLMEDHGADALRWFMAAGGSPWLPRRVGHTALQEIVRKVLLTYWNTVSFQSLYARTAGWTPSSSDPSPADRPLLDRWALSEAHRLVRDADAAYADFDTTRVGALISTFVDDLSNWYVRRSRRRFWDGDRAALATLHECLVLLTQVMAPLTPFVTERVWQDLVVPVTPGAADSVHLSDWPQAELTLVDDALSGRMALVRRLVELGRAARAESKVRTRQPLAAARVAAPGWEDLPAELRAQVADELNVAQVRSLSGEGLVDVSAKANFRALGKRFGKGTPAVAAAVAAADAAALVSALRADGRATVVVDGEQVELGPDEVVVTETPREGWAVVGEGGESVALDLHLTPELVRAGLAREAVRLVQEARKSSGFEVSDRIALWWQAEGELAQALRELGGQVAEEVLAVQVTEGEPTPAELTAGTAGAGAGSLPEHGDADLGLRFWVARR
ncbi:MAG: isoleucine--tRNA ligase [Motilibacteraceae bacterium]